MIFGLFSYDWTILLVLPALIISIWAQIKVNSTYKKYSDVMARRGITAAEAARRILDADGLHDVTIEHISGHLTDHFDPNAKVIRLSDSVYASTSVAAIGVAAHEAGHAIQHAKGYGPIRLRQAIIPVTKIGSMMAIPLFFLGLLMTLDIFMLLGIVLYATIAFFQLVTLPVEFNASARALANLRATNMLDSEELSGSKKVLTAAALTYVAALLTSLLTLLRLIALASGGSRRR